jgi:hypothetical protein
MSVIGSIAAPDHSTPAIGIHAAPGSHDSAIDSVAPDHRISGHRLIAAPTPVIGCSHLM